MLKKFAFFLLFFSSLFAEENPLSFESVLTATLSNDPSSVIDGKVSVVTGEPCVGGVDLVIVGAEPIIISRYFLPGKKAEWNLAWSFAKGYTVPDSSYRFVFQERGEAPIVYKKDQELKSKTKYKPSKLNKGLTNTKGDGFISGRTNPFNHLLFICPKFKSITLKRADGTTRKYKKVSNSKDEYQILSEHLPNGNWIIYDYIEGNEKPLLSKITTTNPSKTKIYATATFNYQNPIKSKNFQIIGSDGQTLSYFFDQNGMLASVVPSSGIEEKFEYEDETRIKKINLPKQREWVFTYENDKIANLTFGKVGPTFSYKKNPPCGGMTSVLDAENNLTEYEYGEDLRILNIKHYGKNEVLVSKEAYLWGDGLLQCKILKDKNENVLEAHRYYYDIHGNLIEEKFIGNLTGSGPTPVLNHLGEIINKGESFSKRYQYNEDKLPIEETDDLGKKIKYSYLPKTNLLTSVLTFDKETIIKRQFFSYDEDHILVLVIDDDGCGLDENDLTNVTVRNIQTITPIQEGPYVGLPQSIEEKNLKKSLFTYTKGGKVKETTIFDSEGNYAYSIRKTYDAKGRVIEEIDPLSHSHHYTYDSLNNLTSHFTNSFKIKFEYDLCNDKVLEHHIGADGIQLTKKFLYDKRHRLIEEIDARDNKTTYLYDPLGRKIEMTLPSFKEEKATYSYEYDSQGNVILTTTPLCNKTKTSYNSRHKPIQIIHPDKTKEEFSYFLNGNLKTHTDPAEVVTTYSYDILDQVTSKTISYKGKKESLETNIYKGSLLIENTDSEGYVTTYFYDKNGRINSVLREKEKTIYGYDSLGRVSYTQKEDLRQIKEYDLLNHVLVEKEELASGKLLSLAKYSYDEMGRLAKKFTYHGNIEGVEEYEYDSLGRNTKKISPEGLSTWTYFEDYRSHAQEAALLKQTIVDPTGLETVTFFDPQGKVFKKEIWKGRLLSSVEKSYTLDGELREEVHVIFSPREKNQTISSKWLYDPRGRIKTWIQGEGSYAKVTEYHYNTQGLLIEKVDPKGTKLFYEYTPLGFLKKISSSDFTVNHRIEYDKLGRIISFDGITRKLDSMGRILEEKFLENGSLASQYDLIGNRISLEIKNHANISYQYEGSQLKQITRKKGVIPLYSHFYTSYDLAGNLLSDEMIFCKGKKSYSVDILGRSYELQSPFFSQKILHYDLAGNIQKIQVDDEIHYFDYDELYQLKKEKDKSYLYNSIGNRLENQEKRFTYNQFSENSLFSYDEVGNPLKIDECSYSYDALGRLIEVKKANISKFFTYDYLDRRLSETSNGKTIYFLYDGMHEIGAINESNQLLELRVLGNTPCAEMGSAISIEKEGIIFAPIHDLLGNIVTVLPSNNNTAIHSRYSAFGERKGPSYFSPWGFASKREDTELKMIFFGRRYYLPEYGSWLTPDPLGQVDSVNLYAFVHNNPLIHKDPFGLITYHWKDGWVNTPAGSPYSYTTSHLAPSILMHPTPSHWNQPAPHPFLMAINPSPKYAPHYYVNGIGNSFVDHQEGVSRLQKTLSASNFNSYHSKSFGNMKDLFSVFSSKKENYTNDNIISLTQRLKLDLACMDILQDQRKIFITCFSRGASDVWHATKDFPQESRNRFIINACGPTMVLPKDLGYQVTNFISEGDFCSLFCNGIINQNPSNFQPDANVIFLSPQNHKGTWNKEHYFLNETYQKGLDTYMKPQYEQFGR